MISQLKLLAILLFCLALIMCLSCEKRNSKWQGTIEVENGVSVVKNPKESMNTDAISLEEDLTLGEKEGNEEHIFYRAQDVEADREGNIYVLDSGDKHIKVFDKNGQLRHVFGREGQGPGELSNPVDIYVDEKDLIYISDVDTNRLSVFNNQGEFVHTKSFDEYSLGRIIGVDGNGDITLIMNTVSKESNENFFVFDFLANQYSSQSDFIRNLYSSSIPVMQHYRKEGKMLALSIPFQKELCCSMDSLGNVYMGETNDYEIHVYSPEGILIRRIRKEYDKIKVLSQDVADYVNGEFQEDENERKFWAGTVKNELKSPEYKPVFEQLFCVKDKLLVKRSEEGNSERSFFDIFSSEGRYLGSSLLDVSPKTWKNNSLYTIEKDKEGYQFVKRYKVTWKI